MYGRIIITIIIPLLFLNQGPCVKEVQFRIKLLKSSFDHIRKATLQQLEEKPVSFDDLCDKVTTLNSLREDTSIKFFIESKVIEFCNAGSKKNLFRYLNTYWSYLSFQLLEHIIDECSLEGVGAMMEEYKQEVKAFKAEMPLKLFAEAHKTDDPVIPSGFKELISHHKLSEVSTLMEVENIRVKLRKEYRLEDCALMLRKVIWGSVVIVWLVPESIAEHILSSTTERGAFQDIGLTQLECDGRIIYNDDNFSKKEKNVCLHVHVYFICFL